MGRQVNFFMHPDDLAEFEADLRSQWKVRFIPAKLRKPKLRYLSSVALKLPEPCDRDDFMIYICREGDSGQLGLEHRPYLGYWTVEIYSSPVIEFSRSSFDGNIIRAGRLYFKPEGKPVDFVKWADAVIRRTRKRYVREGFYVAPHAAAWRKETGGEFRQL